MEQLDRITFWRPGGIGDTLLAVPALQILRAETTRTIHFVGHMAAGKLLKKAGLIDEAHKQSTRNSPDNLYSGAVEISGRLGMNFDETRRKNALSSMGDPDLVVAFSTDPMGMSYAFQELRIPKYTVQFWQPPPGTHQAEFMVLALRNVGILEKFSPNVVDWKCDPPDVPYLNVHKSIILHPGAGLDYKKWPLDKWVELSQKLQSLGSDVLVLEGPEEASLNYKQRFIGSRVLSLTLEETAGLLGKKIPYIGNDSGITHLASLSGCNTLGLYGPTHDAEWGPIGPNVRIIRRCTKEPTGMPRVCSDEDCMNNITVHNVLDIFIREMR